MSITGNSNNIFVNDANLKIAGTNKGLLFSDGSIMYTAPPNSDNTNTAYFSNAINAFIITESSANVGFAGNTAPDHSLSIADDFYVDINGNLVTNGNVTATSMFDATVGNVGLAISNLQTSNASIWLSSSNASNITQGTLNNARLPSTISVSTLEAGSVNLGTAISNLQTSNTSIWLSSSNASNITEGTLANDRLPSTISVSTLEAGSVNLGTAISNLQTSNTSIWLSSANASNLTTGTLANARLDQDLSVSSSITAAGVNLGTAISNLQSSNNLILSNIHLSGFNVGIGATSPSAKLHVVGNVYSSSNLDTSGWIGINSNHYIREFVGSATDRALLIGYDGNTDRIGIGRNADGSATLNIYDEASSSTINKVGINTGSPSANLHVVGNVYATSDLETNGIIKGPAPRLQSTTTNNYLVPFSDSSNYSDSDYFYIRSIGDEISTAIFDNVNRRLGIGTITPRDKLVVAGATNADVSASIVAGSESNNASLYFGTPYDTNSAYKTAIIAKPVNTDKWSRANLHFCLNNTLFSNDIENTATVDDARMTILSTGNVGIGTTSPSANLHVVGNVYSTSDIEGALISATGQTLPLGPTSAGVHMGLYGDNGAGIEIISDDSSWGVIDFNKSPGATNWQQRIAGGNGDRLDFYTGTNSGGGVRMAIDSSGEVGIGTTNPGAKLEIQTTVNNHLRLQYSTGYYWDLYRWNNAGEFIIAAGDDSRQRFLIHPAAAAGEIRLDSDGANRHRANSGHYFLTLNGFGYQATYASAFNVSSDDRCKHNEEEITDALGTIDKLQVYKYDKTGEMFDSNFNGDIGDIPYTKEIGVIAQDVQQIPELSFLVKQTPTSNVSSEMPLSLDYQGLYCMSIQAIQELHTLVKTLTNRIEALENNTP